ncbi:uncharacterized protein LOC126581205 isoform X2 [Anopheles aquasalis]|nr:uncharacterized protein LOC126581205 isoform X2 [Anopheles aquasalis]
MATFPRKPVSRIMKNQAERVEPDNGIKAPRVRKIETVPLEPKRGINAASVPQITKGRVELKLGAKYHSQQPTPDSTSKPLEQPQQRQDPQQQTNAQEKEQLKNNSDMMAVTPLLPSLNDSLGHVRGDTLAARQSFHTEVDHQIETLRSKIASIAEQAEQGQNRIDLEKAKAERQKMDEHLLKTISMESVLEEFTQMNEQFLKEWNEIGKKGFQS